MCVLPPFEAWDEYQHVAYIVHLNETGDRPWFGVSDTPASLLLELPRFPHARQALEQMGSTGALGYADYWARTSDGSLEGPPSVKTPGRIGLYQAQHGPLYYRLMAPLFEALGGVANLRASIAGLRFINLLFTAASVWIAFGIIARRVKNPSVIAFSGLLIALQPLFLMNGVRVANDALGVLLATIAIGWALDLPRILVQRRAIISLIGLGSLTGLAVLAKSVHFGLIPFIAAAWLWGTVRNYRRSRRAAEVWRAMAAAVAMSVAFVAVTQAEFRGNWKRYGTLTVMQESLINGQAGRGGIAHLIATARAVSWRGFAENLWLRKSVMSGGWSWAGANQRMQNRHEFLALAALAGWAWWLVPASRRRPGRLFDDPSVPWICAALCLGYSASLGYHTLQSQLCWGTPSTNPWYAAAAYPWFLLMLTAGSFLWPIGRLRLALPVLLCIFFLETQATIILGSMVATYTAGANWQLALSRLASLEPECLGTTTIHVAAGSVLVLVALALAEAILVTHRSWSKVFVYHSHLASSEIRAASSKLSTNANHD
jgi:hypothetical protein